MIKPLTTWEELSAARDAVAEGAVFAQGAHVDGEYEVRLRRHGQDAIAEVRVGHVDWQPVDSNYDDYDETPGVIDLRDVDPDVDFYAVS